MADRFLSDYCHIEREVLAGSTPFAGGSKVMQPVGGSIKCRLIMKSARSNQADMLGGQEILAGEYELILPHNQDIAVDYRVTIGGVTYEVQRIIENMTDSVFKKVALRAV